MFSQWAKNDQPIKYIDPFINIIQLQVVKTVVTISKNEHNKEYKDYYIKDYTKHYWMILLLCEIFKDCGHFESWMLEQSIIRIF